MIGIAIVLVSAVLALATAFAITPLLMKLLKFVDVKTRPWAQQTTRHP